jgi:3-oxoacyl-[acyl-carrier protein] reductase
MTSTFEGTTALVTGGTKGIGYAIAEALLGAGGKVVVTYSRDEAAAQRLREKGEAIWEERLFVVRHDAATTDGAKELFDEVSRLCGAAPNLLVNNAGILNQKPFADLEESQWDRTFAVNLKGPFLLSQHFLQLSGARAIVNISSIGGQIGGDKAPDYAASKAALLCFTKSLARIGSRSGIRVNAVAPGWIRTDIFSAEQAEALTEQAKQAVPLGRMGEPSEVARAVLFLLSDDASYITGHCLNVNGGLFME